MIKAGVKTSANVDTYETLKEKLAKVQKAKVETEAELKDAIQALNETKKLSQEQENDDLDTFMANLQKTQKGQKDVNNPQNVKSLKNLQSNPNLIRPFFKILICPFKSILVPFGPFWSFMVLYGPFWSFMVLFGPL